MRSRRPRTPPRQQDNRFIKQDNRFIISRAASTSSASAASSDEIDDRLRLLERKARDVKADAELRALEAEIPLSPLSNIQYNQLKKREASKAAASAAHQAAVAAAKRSADLDAEHEQRMARAAAAAAEAAASEEAAVIARKEAEAAADAAAAQREQELRGGERRRRPKPTPTIEEEDAAAKAAWGSSSSSDSGAHEQLRQHVAKSDWVSAARVAVAMALQQTGGGADDGGGGAAAAEPEGLQTIGQRAAASPPRKERSLSPKEKKLLQLESTPSLRHEFGVGWVVAESTPTGESMQQQPQRRQPPPPPPPSRPAAHETSLRELTPRRLRARMLAPDAPLDPNTDNFSMMVDKMASRMSAREAANEPADMSGMSFVGVASDAVHRAIKHRGVGARKPRRDRTRDRPAASEPRAERVDLGAVERAEKEAFIKAEKRQQRAKERAATPGPHADERILSLVKELDEPRVVRDFDAEIQAMMEMGQLASRPTREQRVV